MNAKAAEHRRSEPCGLDVTISARYDWSVVRQSTSFPLRHWNLRNLTLQTCLSITRYFFHLHSTLARLYNAAASPASRLRSAGSLAIMRRFLGFLSFFESSTTLKMNEEPSILPVETAEVLSWCCTWSIWRVNWSTGFGCTYRCCRYCKLVVCSGAGGMLRVFWAAQYEWHVALVRWRCRFVRIQTFDIHMAAELSHIIGRDICM